MMMVLAVVVVDDSGSLRLNREPEPYKGNCKLSSCLLSSLVNAGLSFTAVKHGDLMKGFICLSYLDRWPLWKLRVFD